MRSREELIRDTEPFPDNVIESLPPRGDSYVPWPHYAQRLLLYYGDYEYEVGDPVHGRTVVRPTDGQPYEESVWAVRVSINIKGTTYSAIGEGDSPTSAESNAFKRACAHAGIGLHLYGGFWLHNRLQKE